MKMIKRVLSPAGRERYSDIRKYVTERIPRLYDQLVGRDLMYFPQIRCRKKHIGSRYDGKHVCIDTITPESIVYSFGVGKDISFDLGLIERFGVNIHAFDPTPVSKAWLKSQVLPEKFHFYDFGLANYDGVADFYPFSPEDPSAHDFNVLNTAGVQDGMVRGRVHRMATIMKMLGHKKIDVLKIDIEGSEYPVIDDILECRIEVGQLLVEFHHRYKEVGLQATDQAIKALIKNGFKIFNIGSDGQEYSFLRI